MVSFPSVLLSWSLEKIVGGEDISLPCNGKGVVPPAPAVRMKSGGKNSQGRIPFIILKSGKRQEADGVPPPPRTLSGPMNFRGKRTISVAAHTYSRLADEQ